MCHHGIIKKKVKMNAEEIVKELKYCTGVFPRQALQEAVARKEEITPALLMIIEDAKLLPPVLHDENYMAHIYAMYLLAQFREKRAYPLIVEFFSLPGEIIMECTGDVVTEDLHRILASVSHGDTSLVKSLAQKDEVNGWVRSAALQALLTQLVCGEATREDVMAYYETLFRGGLTRKPSQVWDSLVSCSTDLYPDEVMGDINQAFEEGLVDETFIDLMFVRKTFGRGKARVLRDLIGDRKRQFIKDTIEDIGWWACFHDLEKVSSVTSSLAIKEERQKTGFRDRIKVPPAIVKTKVGRNDLCPCGSGKKFKKCCGK
jgi:hypothetical protein